MEYGFCMKKRAIIPMILLVVVCTAIGGCRKDLSSTLNSQGTLRAVIYESGEPSYERTIKPNSREFRELANWAQRNSDGWEPNMITVKPGILVEGKDFRLIIRPEGATFIYDGGQFARHIPAEDYEHFYRLFGGFSVSGL